MYARRDCRAADRATARQRRRPLSARPPSQRATQRAACQATNASAPASVASSMASSERSDLGSACTTVTAASAGSTVASAAAPGPSAAPCRPPRRRSRPSPPAPSPRSSSFADPDPPHGGGMEALVAVDDGEATDLGQRVDVEQRRQTRWPHQRPVNVSRSRLNSPPPADWSTGWTAPRRRRGCGAPSACAAVRCPCGPAARDRPRRCGRAGRRAPRSAGAACRARAA